MEQIRYTERVCSDQKAIDEFLRTQRVGVLGMKGGDYPYVVPVNYVWYKENIYFHGMGSGKKVNLLEECNNVTFNVFVEHGTVKDPVPCHADTSYMSVMIFGKAEKLMNSEEAAEVMQILVDKFMPEFYKHKLTANLMDKYRSGMDNKGVNVYRIIPVNLTAKNNSVSPDQMFHKPSVT